MHFETAIVGPFMDGARIGTFALPEQYAGTAPKLDLYRQESLPIASIGFPTIKAQAQSDLPVADANQRQVLHSITQVFTHVEQ